MGGVLVGRDLIKAAEIRAQVSQIEKYKTAVNTFLLKYGYLPGDIPDPTASGFGFIPRGQYAGEGDGNGVLEGVVSDAANSNSGARHNIGELTVFWSDLSRAGMVDGNFSLASSTLSIPNAWSAPADGIIPESKLGAGNYVYVWSGGYGVASSSDRKNYFGIIRAKGGLNNPFNGGGETYWEPGMTVGQAYNIDLKIDDGYPQSGTVQSNYIYGGVIWWSAGDHGAANGHTGSYAWPSMGPTTAATAYDQINCYDNDGVVAVQKYSLRNLNSVNCALSFKFQ